MPPTSSLWTGVVAALGALIGVLVAQWWTSRREDRNWQRQREMYAEQREDQRQRDHDLWAREDQHRFTDYKRDLYSRQIHSIRELRDSVQDILFRVRFGLSEGQRPFDDIHSFLGHELLERSRDVGNVASMTRDELSLVAPRLIERLATDTIGTLLDARGDILTREDWKAARDKLENASVYGMKDAMREDLAGSSAAPE